MNPTTWRPEDGQLLQNLRLQAGIDSHVFARSNTLSHAQLQELETGVGHFFYSDLIKRHAGVRLLQKLGHELTDLGNQEPSRLLEDLTVNTAQRPNPITPLPEWTHDGSEAQTRATSNKTKLRPIFWMGGICGMALVSLLSLHGETFSPTPPIPVGAPLSDRTLPQESISASPTAEKQAKTPNLEPPAFPSNPAPEQDELASIACEDSHRIYSKTHTTNHPLKPGNYIHIQALTDSVLCVLDSSNQLHTLTLKAGMGQTINGLAPFLLHTSNWQGLQVFFQGRLVRTELADSSHLLLKSLPF